MGVDFDAVIDKRRTIVDAVSGLILLFMTCTRCRHRPGKWRVGWGGGEGGGGG